MAKNRWSKDKMTKMKEDFQHLIRIFVDSPRPI